MPKLQKKLQARKMLIEIEIKETIELWKARIHHFKKYGLIDLLATMYDQWLVAELDRKSYEAWEERRRKLMCYSRHIVPPLRELGKTDDEIVKTILTLPEFDRLYDNYPIRNWFKNSLWQVGVEDEVNDLLFTLYDKGYYEYEIRNKLMDKYRINEEQAEAVLW